MKNLYVIAHAQSHHHLDKLVGGWYDTGLTALGRQQAEQIAARLGESVPSGSAVEVYSSDLMRASETAEPIGRRFRVPVQTLSDLREKSYGEAGGKPQAWLDEQFIFPPRTGNRMDHFEGVAGSETRREFGTRIYRAVDHLIERPCAEQIIVIHGFAGWRRSSDTTHRIALFARRIGAPILRFGVQPELARAIP